MPVIESIVLASLVGGVASRLGWFCWTQRKRVLHTSDEELSRDLARTIDRCEQEEDVRIPGGDGRVVYGRPRKSKIAEMVWRAKAQFGTTERSEANELMVSKFIRDELKDDKVRPSHILAIYPAATAQFFLEYQPEIDARRIQVAAAAKKKERAKARKYWSFEDWARVPCSLVASHGTEPSQSSLGSYDPLDEE
jgi:hypothetical protein